MTTDYSAFLQQKHPEIKYTGFDITPDELNKNLFPFQRVCVRWALQLGKAALFQERGLGKTLQELAWSEAVVKHTSKPVLILAPLAVGQQTVREGKKFGIDATYVKEASEVGAVGIYITNYERLSKFDASVFSGVVLDESSILKSFTGKTKVAILEAFKDTPFKLAGTATPSPNDHLELGNHAQFLGVMNSNEMLSRWFINDTMKAGNYRLKHHAEKDFWRWVTSWAVYLRHPRDLGSEYDMPGYDLPELSIQEHIVDTSQQTMDRTLAEGRLIPGAKPSSTELHAVKRESLQMRVAKAKTIVEALPENEPVIFWCDTNDEADALIDTFSGAVEVRGSHTLERKERDLEAFTDGAKGQIITKSDIAGMGLNWQHCAHQIFLGVNYSFEKWYQAMGRSYRFGQTRPVNIHMIYAETEDHVMATLKTKTKAFHEMQEQMGVAMKEHGLFRDGKRLSLTLPESDMAKGDQWALHLGDCVPHTASMGTDSIDLSIYSPPFSSLYIYSDSEADMGNSADDEEFFKHYQFLIKDLYRITRPGRLSVVHCKDLPLYKNSSEWFGISDFSGQISKAHTDAGWVFHSRITIWKDPVVEMEKTNSHGLLHKNFAQRTQVCRVGLPDYLMVFVKPDPDGVGVDVKQHRKPGDYIGEQPPAPYDLHRRSTKPAWYRGSVEDYNYSIAVWQRYASPVWFDIDQTKVLNYEIARDGQDEKHLCPLQLDVIARVIDLWSNPGDLVYSPFTGVGSEGYEAVKRGRRFVGCELKRSYFNLATKHLKEAEIKFQQPTLFDLLEAHEKEQAQLKELAS
jgi:hypothetical protein